MRTATQLKANIRNLAKKTGVAPQTLYMNYAVERLLKRLSLSKYKQHFILKGGILIAYTIGFDARGTMDLDGTITGYPVNEKSLTTMLEEVSIIDADDNVTFNIKSIDRIHEESEYGGLRVSLEAHLENTKIPFKIDASAGDVVTPCPIEFSHKLMFTDEYIEIMAYNIETVLAEKCEAIISRSIANSRMRDFYDIYILTQTQSYDKNVFHSALLRTSEIRNSLDHIAGAASIINLIEANSDMQQLWKNYQRKNDYTNDVSWDMAITAVRKLLEECS